MPTRYKFFPVLLGYHPVSAGNTASTKWRSAWESAPQSLRITQAAMLISPVDLIGPLYNATGEQEFLEFFVKGTDQDLVPREKPFDIGSQVGLDVVLLEIGREMGQLAGHVVDNADSSEIDATISRMHRWAETLRIKVRSIAGDTTPQSD